MENPRSPAKAMARAMRDGFMERSCHSRAGAVCRDVGGICIDDTYEDSNSFTRAFRAWEGVPPGTWRETHRESVAS
jgi:hypothetical protein